jgi:hypothetical protein
MKGNCNFEKDTYDLDFHFSAQQYGMVKLGFVEMQFWDKDLKRRRISLTVGFKSLKF